jgi:hypothetical protein
VSCITNILYYDTAACPLFEPETRTAVFSAAKNYLLETKNDEIQIETVRVLSNLSRHASFCENDFQNDKSFLEAIVIVLEYTLRDLVFYSVGILINMSLHASVNIYLLECDLIGKLVDVLKDSNLEDMDLARVAAKALHNLQGVPGAQKYWTEDVVNKLDQVTLSVGEELDSIMVSICGYKRYDWFKL